MTTATSEVNFNQVSPPAPEHGTFPIAANTILLRGTMACLDSADRLAVPGAGLDAIGVLEQTYRNRTTDLSGGAAGAIDGQVHYGVHGFQIHGTTPRPRQVVYCYDNQTVTLDPEGGLGIAGIVSEIKTENGITRAYVWQGPHVVALIRGEKIVNLPLGSFRLSTGAAIPAFGNGTADGFQLEDSKALCLRINDDSTTAFWSQCVLPEAILVGATVTLHALVSRVGSADPTTATLTPSVFANREGAAEDAGSNLCTGSFPLFSAATKVVQEVTLPIVGALGGDVLSVGFVAKTSPGLDNDDACVHAMWISIT